MSATPIYLSVVIPVYNEEKTLPLLEARLMPALDALGKSYEVIFVNDGSKDRSLDMLKRMHERHPDRIRVVELLRNAGQHPAVIAGFSVVRGKIIATIDCDLQNPPEDIGRLVAEIEKGHDVVGGIRAMRQDSGFRKLVSRISNVMRERITNIHMTDHGSMARAYTRDIVDQIVARQEATPYIPAISQFLSANPSEIRVGHEERAAGESTYNLYKLIRLNFDLMTSFSLIPLQIFTLVGMALSAGSFALVVLLALRRIFVGPESEGVFTLFAILFLLISVTMTGLGLIGEYIGRIYMEVRKSPNYVIKHIIEK